MLCVDCTGDGLTDHAVTGIGYRETSGYPEYACWDTWSRSVRWERFRAVSDTYAWGVSSATALSLTDSGRPAAGGGRDGAGHQRQRRGRRLEPHGRSP